MMRENGINIHEEWKGMTQPVGLVLEPTILDRFGIFPERNIKVISDLHRRLESLMVEKTKGSHIYSAVLDFRDFCKEVLNWEDSDLLKPEEFCSDKRISEIIVLLEDYEEVLKPDWIIPEINKENEKKVQIIVKELEIGTPFDKVVISSNKKSWEATPQQRFERLMKDTENPIGILWNGISLRLVYAPRGESSGHITFPLEPMISVDGRPMIAAIEMLLGPDRLFEGGSSDLRLRNLMEQSRKEQNEVSNRLSEQVLEALWILLRGFDEAEKNSNKFEESMLDNLVDKDPSHVYGGLITVLLRLVFLLYSEDEELMPNDSLYVQNYSVNGLASRLRKDRIQYQGAMTGRRGAWSSLLSLFRLVFDGGGPYQSYLPGRHGELFDPDTFPFLEGREINSSYRHGTLQNIPDISDDVVERILSKLLILDGQVLSYRALDVEQIGSVYESIMGFTVQRVKDVSIGINYRPPRQKIFIPIVISADELLSIKESGREKWIIEETGVDFGFSSNIKNSLKSALNCSDLCQGLENKLSKYTPRGLIKGSLVLQPTVERRNTGSHYTPRTLTQPIIQEVFRPWLESCKFAPSAEQILNVKVCDPAMGSGAFLVEACRFLASYLVKAWNNGGFPSEFDESYDKDIYARRLVSQSCLYGLDKNPFAVSLAKLSIWLVTLSKDLPFTFLDHSLKCGDSLVGYSVAEIQKACNKTQLSLINNQNQVFNFLTLEREHFFSRDSRDDDNYDKKQELLQKHLKASERIRQAGDLMIAAFFETKTKVDAKLKQESYLSFLNDSIDKNGLKLNVETIRKELSESEMGIKPFHWDLEFPEIFDRPQKGFDFFIGNPPFMGGHKMKKGLRDGFQRWLQTRFPESNANADLSSFFFRLCFDLLGRKGTLGLIATNSIAQGETRESGLRWICLNGGEIYSTIKRYKWPGVAAVVVSVVNIFKGIYQGQKKIDSKNVDQITAFLFSSGAHENPKKLIANTRKSFQGSIVLGKGFTFDDSKKADETTPGIPSPISSMRNLIKFDEKNKEIIYPYLGGDEVNSSPTNQHRRYVINFGEKSQEECQSTWPSVFSYLEKKVKPERISKSKEVAKYPWWLHLRPRSDLYSLIKDKERVLVSTRHQLIWEICFVSSKQVFSDALVIFNYQEDIYLGLLQSQIHEIWANFFGSTMGSADALRYTPSNCFETFPMPNSFISYERGLKIEDHFLLNKFNLLSKQFDKYRSEIMQSFNEGLTKIYGRFHSPFEENEKILNLRKIHKKIDQMVCELYNWDLEIAYGYCLDYLDIDEDDELPMELKDRISSGVLFFEDEISASSFENYLKSYTKRNRKLNWRYRWPNSTREDVLARLLDLNSKRYSNELNSGLDLEQVNTKESFKMNNFIKKNSDQLEINL